MRTHVARIDMGRPSEESVRRATFVVAVGRLLKALKDCEDLPQPVLDAVSEVSTTLLDWRRP